jgi:hypothetical protein
MGGYPTNRTCAYQGYEGSLVGTYWSAKNNCGGLAVRIGWNEGGSTNWKACLNTGAEASEPGRFNYENVIAGGGC